MKNHSTVVGLDVHKESIAIALAPERGALETRFFGEIGGDLDSFGKAVRKWRSAGGKLRSVYEAGPVRVRDLPVLELECAVVAPSLIPKKSGDRVKTDRRDAMNLARLHRSGELTAVYVPTEEDEAMRDLSRRREDAVKAQNRARLQLGAFLSPQRPHGRRVA